MNFKSVFFIAGKYGSVQCSTYFITKHYNIEILLSSIAQSPGQYFPYCPAVRAIQRMNSSNIDLQDF